MNQVLSSAPYCSMYSRTQVNCSRPLTGNFGQVRIDPADRDGATNKGKAGVDAAQRGTANQLWEQASARVDRGDYRGALPLLLQGARMGDARAQSTLGIIYQDGKGLRSDDRAAAYWFGLAAAQRHRAAEYALSGMYEEGEGGLAKDRGKALQLLQDSAQQNFDKAQLALGIDYEIGDGVTRSREKAVSLLRQAGAQGYDQLGTHLSIILSDPKTPAHFNSLNDLAKYLQKLRSDAVAANMGRQTHGRAGQLSGMARYNAAVEMNNFMRQRGVGNGGNP
jgi:TPR repeat protein